jgi:serine/threonine protein kinase
MIHALDAATLRMSPADVSAMTTEALLRHRLEEAVAGEFRVGRLLGRGGMGAVFEAHDPALERSVAIKVTLPQLVSPEAIERFRREARTVARLDHPNIVPVFAVREAAGLVFLVMRYVEGITLEARLRAGGPLPIGTAQSILAQVGSALAHAHHLGVVHRDVKPSNVMIGPDDWAVVTDFGLAKVHNVPELTATGTTVGTPSYMSPEQCADAPITAASDQYSLGVMAYEMLTGTTPFRASTLAALVKQHMFDDPPPLEQVLPGCPTTLCEAVTRMLQKRPENRWPSIDQAVAHIGGVAAPLDDDLGRTRPLEVANIAVAPTLRLTANSSSGVSRPARRRMLLRGASVAVIGALAAAAVLPGRPPDAVGAVETGGAVLAVADTLRVAPPPTAEARRDTSTGTPVTVGTREPAPVRFRSIAAPSRETPRTVGTGQILLGTRGLEAVLYVNGQAQGAIDRLRPWPVPAGTVRLSIRADGCAPWDSTVTVRPDEQTRIGYRAPGCTP